MVTAGPEEAIRVLACDDHELFRRGLRMVLEVEDGIEVVAEAEDGEAAVRLVEELAPDVVLMDVRMPRMDGVESTKIIRQRFPTTRIIVLSASDEEDDVFGAFQAGANGYLLKEVSIEEVAGAVRSVHRGDSLISAHLAARFIVEFGEHPSSLSSLESEVLRLLARGTGNEQVANALDVPPSTVRNCIGNILVKLQQRRPSRVFSPGGGEFPPEGRESSSDRGDEPAP